MMNRWMASCLALLLVGGALPEVHAQESRTSVRIRLEAGGSRAALAQVRDTFAELLGAYRSAGVPLPDQRTFPAGPQFGGAILTPVTDFLYTGVAVGTMRTSAVSLYGDFAGTVDVRAQTSAVFLNLTAEVDIPVTRWFVPSVGVEGGAMLVRTQFEQDVVFDYGELQAPVSSSYELEVEGKKGYNFAPFVGMRWYVGPVALAGRFGYRRAVAPEAEVTERVNGEAGTEGSALLEQDLSGVMATLGVVLDL